MLRLPARKSEVSAEKSERSQESEDWNLSLFSECTQRIPTLVWEAASTLDEPVTDRGSQMSSSREKPSKAA